MDDDDDLVRWEMYFHFVWTTEARQMLIEPYMEPDLLAAVKRQCEAMSKVSLHGVNAMPDHIHIIASVPPTMTIDDFVAQIKDYTAQFMRHEYEMPFSWQSGYGAIGLGADELDLTIKYIAKQKEHHRAGTTIFELERVSDEDEGPGSPHPN
jgi:putative transposase